MTTRSVAIYEDAVKQALDLGVAPSTVHMLYQILLRENSVASIFLKRFADLKVLKHKCEVALRVLMNKQKMGETEKTTSTSSLLQSEYDNHALLEGKAEIKRASAQAVVERPKAQTDTATEKKGAEALEGCGLDMTERARKGKMDPVIGRKREIESVVQILSRRQKNNPVLIGEPGVGKSAIVEGIAQLIVKNQVPEQLYNKRVFSVDLPGMLAGTRYRGEFEEKHKNL